MNVARIIGGEVLGKQFALLDAVSKLGIVNEQLKVLEKQKDDLTVEIIQSLNHDHEGEKSYYQAIYKITCRTPMTYILDKNKYEEQMGKLPVYFNPIRESKSYTIDKRLCEQYLAMAPKEIKSLLIDLISKKPAKPSVSIKIIGQ